MAHLASDEDRRFRHDFESLRFPPSQFHHREHLRLAYVYLCDHSVDSAHTLMRSAILSFLAHLKVDPLKYHETVTRAWILAVRHFIAKTSESDSFSSFVAQNPTILDSKIMHTHYSTVLLSLPDARASFLEPDLEPIPRYE